MATKLKLCSFILFAIIVNQSVAQSLKFENIIHFTDSLISDGVNREKIVGGVIALYQKNEIQYIRGFGLSNIKENIPAESVHPGFAERIRSKFPAIVW